MHECYPSGPPHSKISFCPAKTVILPQDVIFSSQQPRHLRVPSSFTPVPTGYIFTGPLREGPIVQFTLPLQPICVIVSGLERSAITNSQREHSTSKTTAIPSCKFQLADAVTQRAINVFHRQLFLTIKSTISVNIFHPISAAQGNAIFF